MRTVVLLCVALAFGACERRDPVADDANSATEASDVDVLPADESSVTPTEDLQNGATDEPANGAAATIPAAFQGRWGLSPADCTSSRGDAKGLLTISGSGMRFYESVARPAGPLKLTDDSLNGQFAFTGEGMSWTRHQVLQLQDSKLVRTESAPMASFTYARCSG